MTDKLQDDETRRVMHWISSENPWSKQEDVLRQRQAGTGQWLLEHSDFVEWAEGIKDRIWCVGSRK